MGKEVACAVPDKLYSLSLIADRPADLSKSKLLLFPSLLRELLAGEGNRLTRIPEPHLSSGLDPFLFGFGVTGLSDG